MKQPISVSQLNQYVSALLDRDSNLNPVMVKGEISGFKAYPSGHLYFTLKDEKSAVSCVMFKSSAGRLRFRPSEGNKVIVTARAGIYDRDGRFQLYINEMVSDGLGDLYLAFEQLKKQLEQEGLFDSSHKKKIPFLPRKIGVATSASGAVIRDIIQVLGRRYPNFSLQLIPVSVQGPGAAQTVAAAIKRFNELKEVDVIIVGRGGGSLEDLWAFNEEIVARAVFASKIPIISAVGHETDFTICDFVADLRAPTPSAAAELAMPVRSELENSLREARYRLQRGLQQRLERQRHNLDNLTRSRVFRMPLEKVEKCRLDLDRADQALLNLLSDTLKTRKNQLSVLSGKLEAMDPQKVLARGYSITRTVHDARTLMSTALVKVGDEVDVLLCDGILNCEVKAVQDNTGRNKK